MWLAGSSVSLSSAAGLGHQGPVQERARSIEQSGLSSDVLTRVSPWRCPLSCGAPGSPSQVSLVLEYLPAQLVVWEVPAFPSSGQVGTGMQAGHGVGPAHPLLAVAWLLRGIKSD